MTTFNVQMMQITRNVYLDLLKFMAIFVMVLDHIGHFLLPDDLFTTTVIRGIGRFAMPLFFITHGYLLSQRPHPPSLKRIAKLLMYGSFLSVGLYAITNEFTFNILFQFALVEIFWLRYIGEMTIKEHLLDGFAKKNTIQSMLETALILLLVDQVISLEQIIDYGVYPLFYAVAGLMFGYAHHYSEQRMEKVAFVVLITTLSFEYNPFLVLLYSISVDNSMLYFALPSLIIPILVWYIPKANIELTTLRLPIALVSRNALNIYVVHLLAIIAIRLALPL